MWRYWMGGGAGLAALAAGAVLWSARETPSAALPAQPAAHRQADAEDARPGDDVPEASARTREEKRFDRYDKDRNGSVTREEYLASRRKAYAKLDTDGDGRLSFDEWAAKTTGKFAAADRDHDGAMSRDEFATTAVKRKPSRPVKCPPERPSEES